MDRDRLSAVAAALPHEDPLALLEELLAPPAWHARAACRGMGVAKFFPEQHYPEKLAEARAVCAGCPVRSECLDAGLAGGRRTQGVWGGTSAEQRKRTRREIRSTSAPAA